MGYTGIGNNSQFWGIESGIIKWLNVVQGGGSVAALGATVAGAPGIGADFTSINAAVAANNNIIHVIGNTTEPGNTTIPSSGLTLTIHGNAIIDMDTNNFSWSNNAGMTVEGNGSIRHAVVAGTGVLFDSNGNIGRVIVDGVQITNASSATSVLADGTSGRFSNCVLAGDVTLTGTRNQLNGCDIGGNLTILPASIGAQIASCQIDGTIVDAGSGTVISDSPNY